MFNYLLYRLGQFLVLALPLKLSYHLAIFFSDVHFLFANIDRKTVKENLKAIFPEKTSRERNKIRLEMFRNFAKYLVDFFRFSILNKEYIRNNITIENLHYLDDTLKKGKGGIILTAHIGNWELGGVVTAQLGYPFWAVALPHKNKKVNDFFNFQRAIKNVKIIPFGNAVRQSLKVLKDNKLLALVGDRDFTKEKGVAVDFLNKFTTLPKGPAAFALKTGAPIIPGFMLRNPDDSFTLRFEKPIEIPAQTLKNQDKNNGFSLDDKKVEEITILYKAIIETYIRKYPEQWYMFRKYWIEP
ncbi:MAG: lysophospholipid acyltransferase family protein [Candidatus Omnitrophota bacterium]|jgi:KDO2-lipid IV(A) lauroyltransferase